MNIFTAPFTYPLWLFGTGIVILVTLMVILGVRSPEYAAEATSHTHGIGDRDHLRTHLEWGGTSCIQRNVYSNKRISKFFFLFLPYPKSYSYSNSNPFASSSPSSLNCPGLDDVL
jgi:hypothetical protein